MNRYQNDTTCALNVHGVCGIGIRYIRYNIQVGIFSHVRKKKSKNVSVTRWEKCSC